MPKLRRVCFVVSKDIHIYLSMGIIQVFERQTSRTNNDVLHLKSAGMLGAICYFVEPKETYLSVQNATYLQYGVYGIFLNPIHLLIDVL